MSIYYSGSWWSIGDGGGWSVGDGGGLWLLVVTMLDGGLAFQETLENLKIAIKQTKKLCAVGLITGSLKKIICVLLVVL
ncbi:hypothetical protein Hanom_Chr09g00782891 [Helianthus anomalus]